MIGWVVSRGILLVVFYGVLTPLGALYRLIGRDVLQLKPDPGRESYWAPRDAPTRRPGP